MATVPVGIVVNLCIIICQSDTICVAIKAGSWKGDYKFLTTVRYLIVDIIEVFLGDATWKENNDALNLTLRFGPLHKLRVSVFIAANIVVWGVLPKVIILQIWHHST